MALWLLCLLCIWNTLVRKTRFFHLLRHVYLVENHKTKSEVIHLIASIYSCYNWFWDRKPSRMGFICKRFSLKYYYIFLVFNILLVEMRLFFNPNRSMKVFVLLLAKQSIVCAHQVWFQNELNMLPIYINRRPYHISVSWRNGVFGVVNLHFQFPNGYRKRQMSSTRLDLWYHKFVRRNSFGEDSKYLLSLWWDRSVRLFRDWHYCFVFFKTESWQSRRVPVVTQFN